MKSFIQTLPNLISSTDTNLINEYDLGSDFITDTMVKYNFTSLEEMTLSYDYTSKYDDFAKGITKAISVKDFISKLANEDPITAKYLENVASTFSITDTPENVILLIWGANITNKLGQNEERLSENLSDLYYSMSAVSDAYKPASPLAIRGKILEIFENDINKDRAKSYLGINFMDNEEIKNSAKWINFNKLEDLQDETIVNIDSYESLVNVIKSPNPNGYKSAISYISAKYLNSTDEKDPAYCENDAVREYKATIILASLAKEFNGEDFDKDNELGLNLCAKLKNLPNQILQDKNLLSVTNIINKHESNAGIILSQILGKKLNNKFAQPVKNSNTITPEMYLTKQLSTFKNFVEKKLKYYEKTLVKLDNGVKTSGFNGNTLKEISSDLSLDPALLPIKYNKESFADTCKTLADLMRLEHDSLNNMLRVFAKVKRKSKNTLDPNIEFDKQFIGDLVSICEKSDENIIKNFYTLVNEDPILKKTDAKLRIKTPTFIMTDIQKRATQDNSTPELLSILKAHKLTPAQQKAYEEDLKLDDFEAHI